MSKLAVTVMLLHVLSIHSISAQSTVASTPTTVTTPPTTTPIITTTTPLPTTTAPANHGENCSSTTKCAAGLSCLNTSKCGCQDSEYFDPNNTTDFCPDRKPNGGSCNITTECKPGLTCFANNKTCGCQDTEYLDPNSATDLCPDKVAYNGSCNGSFTNVCLETNTECVSYHASTPSRCLCTSHYYRSGNNVCISESNLKITDVHHVRAAAYIVFYWTDHSNNNKVMYTISWNGMTPIPANKSEGNATGLTPGIQYSFNITTTLLADESYPAFTSVSIFPLWTFPEKPGPVKTISLVSSSPALYEITFSIAAGAVSYRMNVSGDVEKNNTSTTPTVRFELTPAKNYTYTITSFNGAKDESEPTAGSFTTNSTAPGPVGDLITTEVLNSTAKIKWQTPSSENGHLRGYFVQVKEGTETEVCLYNIKLKCNDCTQELDFTDALCGTTQTANSSYNVSSKYYLLELPLLKSYSNYTVVVVAVNEIGKGAEKSVSFRTDVGVPYRVSDILLNSTRNESTLKVSLDVSWTAGELTGPTNYSILVQKETGLGTNVYSADATYTVTGYSNTTYFLKEVLAYWQYKVSVNATTIIGSSESTPTQIRTDQTNPGLVQYLTVTQDTVVAKAINLTFLCPGEQEQNGIIKGFLIKQLDNVTGAVSTYNHTVVTCGSQNIFNGVTNITVGHGYNFTVKAVNDRYEGDFGPPKFLSVETKVPQLKPVMNQLKADKFVKAPDPSAPQETSIALVVCAECLADNSQGEIIHAGLVICVKGVSCPTTAGRKRRALSASDYSNYMSWSTAAKNKFISQYRTTPDDWRNTFTLQRGNPYAPYTVGLNTSCDRNAEAVFCNGPLPEGKTILITVVVCTSAGCEVLENKDEYVLKVRTDEGLNVGAIVGGIIGGLAFIVIVCLIVVFLYRRNQPKKSQPSRTSAWELDAKDKEIKLKRPVKIRNFGEHVARFHRDSNLMFQDEFENIQTVCKTFTYTTEQAKIEQNRMKNRYVDIIPYDHSRVKLNIVPEDDETKDFINANYIPGYNSVREYIATQGPMYSTVPDFWRMAWEQKCKVIIMLSDLMEKGKRKVDLYWPENLNEPINYDHVVVEMTNFSQVSEYIVRTFKVTKGDEARKMTHLFVPGWPDWTADVGIDYVLNFVKLCRQETPVNPGPIIVHCSAGVGRTGTFIAVDNFTQFVDKRSLNEEIDIFDFVIQMRKNRARMVQVESQYIFIYDAINKVIQQKIKAEEERLYENTSSNGVYANMEQEENIYQNTNGKEDKYVYNNEAFVAEGDYSNVEPLKKSEKPITEL
jgi:protein-tyrosine phosphatase